MKLLTLVILCSTLSVFTLANLLNAVYAQENDTDVDEHKFVAIQHAQSGSIAKINETAYTLELNDVSDKTILFSDRPDRIVKSITTSDFISNWSTGTDSFAAYAPNAVLVVDEIEGQQQDIAIIELFNPVYDSEKNVLEYESIPDNATSITVSNEFGQTTVMIDPINSPCPWTGTC